VGENKKSISLPQISRKMRETDLSIRGQEGQYRKRGRGKDGESERRKKKNGEASADRGIGGGLPRKNMHRGRRNWGQ